MTDKIREQIMQIRASGACNMVHASQVQRLAFERNFHELVIFIAEHRDLYIRFILYGDTGTK
ncbi:MAG: DUF5049 domain-containing protein [Kiritimatiellae bacterium]|nr:DUF5049 domain-containing protein [Kiritimatiellia bacterium]